MTGCKALVHVPGLGADISPDEGRVQLKTALRPFVRRMTEQGHHTDGILSGCQIMLQERPAMPPVAAVFTRHPATRSLQLAFTAKPAVDTLLRAQAFADDFRGPPDSPAALQQMHIMTRRMLGHTRGVEDAKRKARACILRLHPDRCRGLLRIDGPHTHKGRDMGMVDTVELARASLLQGYIDILQSLERPEIGPYIAGPVAFTGREAAQVLMLAMEQRIGRRPARALVAVGAGASAAAIGAACVQIVARHWVRAALWYLVAAVAGWHVHRLEKPAHAWLQQRFG